MAQQIGTRAFLKAEGFEFGLRPDKLHERLRRKLDDEQRERLDELVLLEDGPVRSKGLYTLPKTLTQAHLLFSNDAARILASFDWLADVAAKVDDEILDLGSGSGAFLRLLAIRGKKQQLVGVDASPALVDIAIRNSTKAPNAEFLLKDFSHLGEMGRTFGLVTSACALDWTSLENPRGDDIPLALCLPDKFALSPGVKKRVAAVAEEALLSVRQVVASGGTLAMVERIQTLHGFIAFLSVASEAGWCFDVDRSTKLRFEDESMPGAVFVAADPRPFDIDLPGLVAFWQGAGPWSLPVSDEAAILAYLDLGAAPSDISQKTFSNATMITETGVTSDGRHYRYQYATTGLRELGLT